MLEIKKYKDKNKKLWDNFVSKSNNGTIFQKQHFINYHINRNFIDNSLLFLYKKKLVAIFPASQINKNNKKILYSHPGSSYGGLVVKDNLKFKLIDQIIAKLDQYCINNKFDSIFFIQSPYIYYCNIDFSLEYCLKWNGFKESEVYISHYSQLKTFENPYKLISKRKRRYIKQLDSSKIYNIKQSTNFKEFYTVLLESKKNFKTKPTHSLEELQIISKLFPNECKLFLSYKDKKVIGGSLIFIANKTTGIIFYNAILNKYKNTQLASYQFYNCMKYCKNKKLNYIDFGVSHLPENKNPLTPKLSLIQFKEQFGAKGLIRYVYEKTYNE